MPFRFIEGGVVMNEEEVWYRIQDIVKKHSKQYGNAQYIPNEEIYDLKQDLFKYVIEFTKRNAKR